MEKTTTIYIVNNTENREDGADRKAEVLGVFTTREGAEECLEEECERKQHEWLKGSYEESSEREDWNLDKDKDGFTLASLDGDYLFRAVISKKEATPTYHGYKELVARMNPEQKKAYEWILSQMDAKGIIQGARKCNERPKGYLSDYIRDMCAIPATETELVTDTVLRYLRIDNEYCPWLETETDTL